MMHFGANHFAANHFAARHLRSARAVQAVGGGGSGKGWAHERAMLEHSLTRAQKVVARSPNKVAKRVARKLTQYLADDLDISEIVKEVAALKIEVQTRAELRAQLEAAALELEAFILDEQEAIETLLMAMESDAMCILM
jgi:predicted NAD/FAD-dependent oxidoreductase